MEQELSQIIMQRYSCRKFSKQSINSITLCDLKSFIHTLTSGLFGTPMRLMLFSSTETDTILFKNFGTYGFIKDPQAFVAGVITQTPTAHEEFGYTMEHVVLKATELGLGTCWLGGTFTKSRFATAMECMPNEMLPAVIAIGYPQQHADITLVRKYVHATKRLPFDKLFFEKTFMQPLELSSDEPYYTILDMVRRAPSASNKQPWRIIHNGKDWHFYLQRTEGYGKGTLLFTLLQLADLQRIDIGIAMCHFELMATKFGLNGKWNHQQYICSIPDKTEYIVTWSEQ